ncbi:MAG: TRAP transporter large permease [Oscillibacter sp.]|jgi:C4-dicarboxylate transporter DctM subunit|nr:TRAP transporter large permease [Oscillibacter sp.]MCI9001249.1 TRAP transporter large permease [Oscillibacter sp.]
MAPYLFITFLVTALAGFPIWVVLASSCFVAISAASSTPMLVVAQRMFTSVDSFPLLAIPLFMVAGSLMEGGGISRRLINFCNSLLGSFTGGLAMVAILTCMLFAAISGSGPATVAAIGGIMIPEMVKAGYSKPFAAALMSVAGAIGVIIPPSLPMVNYGIAGSVSISTLFAAGFGPGILVGVALIIVAYFSAKKNGYGLAAKTRFSWRNVAISFKEAFFALMMPFIVLGGIYGGVFTPTEAAAVAAIYGFVAGTFLYRELKLKDLPLLLMNAGKSTAMVMVIVAAASSFGWILTSARIPDAIAAFLISLSESKYVILLLINLFLLIVGCLMDVTASIIILTPIFMPIVNQFGINPVHFGIIMTVNLAIGMSTPPLGVNLFVSCGIAKISIEENARAMVKFLIANLIALLLIVFVEPVSLIIPQLMGLM